MKTQSQPLKTVLFGERGDEPPTSNAHLLLVLGAMGYQRSRDLPVGAAYSALDEFDRLIEMAKRRGFKSRKQLVGAVRRGSSTKFAIEKATEAAELLTTDEVQSACAYVAAYVKQRGGSVEMQRQIQREAEMEAIRMVNEELARMYQNLRAG